MPKISQIFFSFIAFLVFLFLIFFTFSSPKTDTKEVIDYPSLYFGEGDFSLTSSGEVIKGENGDFFLKRFSPGNEIIFSSGSIFESKKQKGKNNILLSSGDFILHASTREAYEINGRGFSLSAPEGGTFFFRVSEKGTINIFSQDSYATLTFLNTTTEERYSNMYIFPHMLVRFNPTRNKFLKNADRIRVDSVSDLDYLFLSFLSSKEAIIKELTDYSFSSPLIEVFLSYKEKDIFQSESLQGLIIKRNKSFYFPGQSAIEKYKALFLNRTKKIAYYEGLFQEKIENIFLEDNYKQDLITGAISNINELKNIDETHYKKALNLFFYYNKIAFSLYDEKAGEVQRMYSEIARNLDSLSSKQVSYLFIPLRNAFNQFDYKGGNKAFGEIEEFEEKALIDKSKDDVFFDYLTYFIEKILVEDSLTHRDDFHSKINILGNYNQLNNRVYGEEDDKKKISGVYVNLAVLRSMLIDIKSVFFETERNTDDILVMKKGVKGLSKEEQDNLHTSFGSIKSFFYDNIELLSSGNEKDKGLIDAYEESFVLYDEYYLALTDYENYTFRYDKATGDLLGKDTLGGQEQEIILGREHFINYMGQFSGINVLGMQLEIKDDTYYRVENIVIGGSIFSFSLYPFNSYEIRDIVINDSPKSVSYKLEIIKEDWKEEQRYSSSQNKKDYDFSHFFQLTFFSHLDNEKEIYDDGENTDQEEDRYAQVFKANKLLGENGEFSLISDFLSIPYETLLLEKKGDNYDIFLSGSELMVKLDSERHPFYSLFDAEYHLSDTEHYFSDIKLKVYKDKERRPDDFYLGNNPFFLVGDVDITETEEKMREALSNLKTIDSLSQSISTSLGISSMEIKYYLPSKKTTIKFDFQGKNANIMLVSGVISSFFYDGKIIISKQTSTKDINSYLEQIKN